MLSDDNSKKRKRYTQDRRSCANVFVYEGNTYFDCINLKSPDGKSFGREWCYVEQSLKGYKDWDYCTNLLDYDKVRKENFEIMNENTLSIKKVINEVSQNIQPSENNLKEFNRLEQKQIVLMNMIKYMFNKIEKINENLNNLHNSKEQWEKMSKFIKELEFKIDQKKDKERKVSYEQNIEITDMSSNNGKVNEFFKNKIKDNEKNCGGMLNYEDDEEGDGLIGKYYNNEEWLGSYKERKDEVIDFVWEGSSPIKGMNIENFSIKWEGYLLAPYTGNYKFSIESNDGVSLIINRETYIKQNMNDSFDNESKILIDYEKKGKRILNKRYSEQIRLIGGKKVK